MTTQAFDLTFTANTNGQVTAHFDNLTSLDQVLVSSGLPNYLVTAARNGTKTALVTAWRITSDGRLTRAAGRQVTVNLLGIQH